MYYITTIFAWLFEKATYVLGFRAWIGDDGRYNFKVPGWYLKLDPGAKRLAEMLIRDMIKNPEDWV
jgi:hypothetical protein